MPDGGYGPVKYPLSTHPVVMALIQTVHMDIKGEVGRGLKFMDPFLHPKGVGTQIDESLPGDEGSGDGGDIRVKQGFAPGNGDYRSPAFLGSGHAFLRRHPLLEDVFRIIDFTTPFAPKVTPEQGFQHQDQRKPSIMVMAQFLSQ